MNWLKKLFTSPKKDDPKPLDDQTIVGIAGLGYGVLDVNSSTWIFITKYANDKISTLRKKNDNTTLSLEKTQLIRGEIKALKALISLQDQVD